MTRELTQAALDAAYAAWSSAVPWTREGAIGAALDAAGHVPPGMPRTEAMRLALAGYESRGDGSTSPLQRALAAIPAAWPAAQSGEAQSREARLRALLGTQYRIVLQFARPDGNEDWQTVAAPVFHSAATAEHVCNRIRDLITRLPVRPGQEQETPS